MSVLEQYLISHIPITEIGCVNPSSISQTLQVYTNKPIKIQKQNHMGLITWTTLQRNTFISLTLFTNFATKTPLH